MLSGPSQMVHTMAKETGQSGWTTFSAEAVNQVYLTVSVATGDLWVAAAPTTPEMLLLSALTVREKRWML